MEAQEEFFEKLAALLEEPAPGSNAARVRALLQTRPIAEQAASAAPAAASNPNIAPPVFQQTGPVQFGQAPPVQAPFSQPAQPMGFGGGQGQAYTAPYAPSQDARRSSGPGGFRAANPSHGPVFGMRGPGFGESSYIPPADGERYVPPPRGTRQLSAAPLASTWQGESKVENIFKQIGFLNPSEPRRFTSRLRNILRVNEESKVLHALERSMISNESEDVASWYDSVMASLDTTEQDARNSVEGWVFLIQERYARDTYQSQQYLSSITFSWDEEMTGYCSKVRAACLEAGILDPAAVCNEITRRLPSEYYSRLLTSYDTVTALERDLKKIQGAASMAHKQNEVTTKLQRELQSATRSRPATFRPEFKKKTDNAPLPMSREKDTAPVPPYPCRQCGEAHWTYGKHRTPCKSSSVAAYRVELGLPIDCMQAEAAEEEECETSGSETVSGPSEDDDGGVDSKSYLIFVDSDANSTCHKVESSTVPSGPSASASKKIVVISPSAPCTESAFRRSTSDQVKVATTAGGRWHWRPLDGGSSISLVSKKFLDEAFPHATVYKKSAENVSRVSGIMPDASTVSDEAVKLTFWIVTKSERAQITATFHVVPSLRVGLLIGNDIIRSFGISIDAPNNVFEMRRHRLVGDLLAPPDAVATKTLQKDVVVGEATLKAPTKRVTFADDNKRPVKVLRETHLRPGYQADVPVSFKAFDKDMLFTGEDQSTVAGEAVLFGSCLLPPGPHHKVVASNVGTTPCKLGAGQVIGSVERADAAAVYTIHADPPGSSSFQ